MRSNLNVIERTNEYKDRLDYATHTRKDRYIHIQVHKKKIKEKHQKRWKWNPAGAQNQLAEIKL